MNTQLSTIDVSEGDPFQGCGPLILPNAGKLRPLRQQIFDRIRAAGLISRVDLAKELDVSPASVTALSSELITLGLIQEVATTKQGSDPMRGRPPVALGVRPDAGHVIGVKLSDLEHTAVILDFSGRRLASASFETAGTLQTQADIIGLVQMLVTKILSQTAYGLPDICAVAVGIPGMSDTASGAILWSPVVTQQNFSLGPELSALLGCPVIIDNDANMVTLAELWFGAGRRLADFAVVTIEHGVGMGLVLDHQVFRGATGKGMEIGHTKVQLDGALCRCGQRGCLEAYVADYALKREASTALNIGNVGASSGDLLESLYSQAKNGNATARAIFDRAGRYLALGLANIINLFDPSLIILSGERVKFDFLYAEEVLAEMQSLSLVHSRILPKVEINAWTDMLWAQGAAALALQHATEIALRVTKLDRAYQDRTN
jgi:predicted NBD/HSP70 family sugar kinase